MNAVMRATDREPFVASSSFFSILMAVKSPLSHVLDYQ
jgi:hypothetical protein